MKIHGRVLALCVLQSGSTAFISSPRSFFTTKKAREMRNTASFSYLDKINGEAPTMNEGLMQQQQHSQSAIPEETAPPGDHQSLPYENYMQNLNESQEQLMKKLEQEKTKFAQAQQAAAAEGKPARSKQLEDMNHNLNDIMSMLKTLESKTLAVAKNAPRRTSPPSPSEDAMPQPVNDGNQLQDMNKSMDGIMNMLNKIEGIPEQKENPGSKQGVNKNRMNELEARLAEYEREKEERKLKEQQELEAAARLAAVEEEQNRKLREQQELEAAARRAAEEEEERQRLQKLKEQEELEARLAEIKQQQKLEAARLAAEEEEQNRIRKMKEQQELEAARLAAEEEERMRRVKEQEELEARLAAEREEQMRKLKEQQELEARLAAEKEEQIRKLREQQELEARLAEIEREREEARLAAIEKEKEEEQKRLQKIKEKEELRAKLAALEQEKKEESRKAQELSRMKELEARLVAYEEEKKISAQTLSLEQSRMKELEARLAAYEQGQIMPPGTQTIGTGSQAANPTENNEQDLKMQALEARLAAFEQGQRSTTTTAPPHAVESPAIVDRVGTIPIGARPSNLENAPYVSPTGGVVDVSGTIPLQPRQSADESLGGGDASVEQNRVRELEARLAAFEKAAQAAESQPTAQQQEQQQLENSKSTQSSMPYANQAKEITDKGSPITIQGGSLKTFSLASHTVERVAIVLKSEGRPLDTDLELWHGPDNTPVKMRVFVEDGSDRPFITSIETPRGPNTVALRNTGQLEFPISACVVADAVKEGPPLEVAKSSDMTIQGGALKTYPFDQNVQSVQVLLRTDGRPLNARIELMQGPNNNKQVVEVYTEDGMDRPFFMVIETPGSGNVVRVVNTAPVEFPLTAWVEEYCVGSNESIVTQPVIGGDLDWQSPTGRW